MLFLDPYKKWTFIMSFIFSFLWLLYFFLIYVQSTDIDVFFRIIFVACMLIYTPVTYGFEIFTKDQSMKYYTSAYRSVRARVGVITLSIFLVGLMVIVLFFGIVMEFHELLLLVLLSSILLGELMGTFESNS